MAGNKKAAIPSGLHLLGATSPAPRILLVLFGFCVFPYVKKGFQEDQQVAMYSGRVPVGTSQTFQACDKLIQTTCNHMAIHFANGIVASRVFKWCPNGVFAKLFWCG